MIGEIRLAIREIRGVTGEIPDVAGEIRRVGGDPGVFVTGPTKDATKTARSARIMP